MATPRKILFFHHGIQPTVAQFAEATSLGRGVRFRCADHVRPEDNMEECDGVAGEVPTNYAAKYPLAKSEPITEESSEPPTGDETGETGEAVEAAGTANPAPVAPASPTVAAPAAPTGKRKRSSETGSTGWR